MKRIGLFFLVLVLVGVSVLAIRAMQRHMKYYSLTVPFENVLTLTEGDLVKMRGVNIGIVSDLKQNGKAVDVLLHIDKLTLIPKGSKFEIQKIGMFGEVFLSVLPSDSAGAYAPDSRISEIQDVDVVEPTYSNLAKAIAPAIAMAQLSSRLDSMNNILARQNELLEKLTKELETKRGPTNQ